MDHVFLGAALPFVIAAAIYMARGSRAGLRLLILAPLAMAALAIWASVPDIPRILGFHGLYMRLDADPRMNVFLWHHAIDQIENESSRWPAVGIVIMGACLMAAAVRELSLREKE